MLTWEGEPIVGTQAIIAKLNVRSSVGMDSYTH